ncbi:tetratricopeptide repeat protein [Cellvibrio sp. OA-2007]|uniref:tetratricopeptide repeat protein n=2 Tax=Cellvibrio sp. OA-2007 TaxID=529823 RepID=UPI001EE73B5E|nr:tetratricopeptide repeat protein [Cellvibrio sp. OA-2007]
MTGSFHSITKTHFLSFNFTFMMSGRATWFALTHPLHYWSRMIKHRPIILSSMTLYWVLSGCSLQSARTVAAPEPQPEILIQTPSKPFPTETLYSLLAAEIAGSRAQYDVALSNYVQQARETRDPQIAERATMIARYLGDNPAALEMARIWVQAAPYDKDALANTSMAYMQTGQLREAFEYSRRLLDEGGEPLFQNIAANAVSLREAERAALLNDFVTQRQRHPEDEQLMVGMGILLQQQGKYDEAMDLVQQTLKIHPRSIPAAILEANLLHQMKRDQEAIAKMANLLEFYPDNTSLRQQYARILTHYDMALAQEQFTILTQQLPDNGDLLLSLGIIALERKDLETAHKSFESLLDRDLHISTAHYYLGRMAEAQHDLPEAIIHYLQVESGNDFLPATISLLDIFVRQQDFLSAQQHMNRLRLRFPEQGEVLYVLHGQTLIKHNHLPQADSVFSEGLANFATSTRLLFARAMLNHQRDRIAAAERDLRQILKQQPDNAAALNSLGYILADRTQRFAEARSLLEKAMQLQPNDPAILDSMGWLHYRTGKYAEALPLLRKAYAAGPNAEISAHLGEILWQLGNKAEARQVWQEGIKHAPNDPVIQETLNRLKADL